MVNVDHTRNAWAGKGGTCRKELPGFFPWTTVPASPALQAAARRVTTCDKTCWAPALLSHWHRARWPRGWADFPAFPGAAWSHQLSSLCCQSSDSFQPRRLCHSLHPRAGCQGMEGGPVLPARVTPFPSSAVRVFCHQTRGGGAFTPQQVQFDELGFSDPCGSCSRIFHGSGLPPFVFFPHFPVCGKAGESCQSHEENNSSSQAQRSHQTVPLLPSHFNSTLWYLPVPKRPTRRMERDIFQRHVVTGQGKMALSWRRIDLDWILGYSSL